MFWFWMTVSICGYSLQGVLMAQHVRGLEALSAGFYRNMTLGLSMLWLLAFVPAEAWPRLPEFGLELGLAALLAALSQWTRFLSLQALPVGVSSAAITGFNVLVTFFLSGWYFSEWLTGTQLLLLGLVLVGTLPLAATKGAQFENLKPQSWAYGAVLILVTSLLLTVSFGLVTKVARELDPFLAAYLWEVLIAVWTIILISGRYALTKQGLAAIKRPQLISILWASAPTGLGTLGFFLAVRLESWSLATGISTISIVLTTLLCAWWYHEKLSRWQYGAIGLTVLGVAGLKLLS